MNPALLATLLSGRLTKDGSGTDAMGGLGSMLAGGNGNTGVAPLLLLLAGMGIPQLSKIMSTMMNTVMDFQSMGKGDNQEQPGALSTPPEGAMPPPGMSGTGPASMAGGPPPDLVQRLLALAAMRRGQGVPMA